MHPFHDATRIQSADEDQTWTANVPDGWSQGRAAFGGIVSALVLRAAQTEAPPDRHCIGFNLAFVGPLRPGHCRITQRILRNGRSVSHIENHIHQEGDIRANCTSFWGTPRPQSIFHAPEAHEKLLPGEEALHRPYDPSVMPEFVQNFEYRWDHHGLPYSGSSTPLVAGWIRQRNQDPHDLALVTALIDAWPPPVWSLLTRPAFGSSVAWQVQFLHPPPEKPGWFYFRSQAGFAANGYSDINAELWDPNGRLLARSRQIFADFSGS
jgi:acyl-CoA thioesterase